MKEMKKFDVFSIAKVSALWMGIMSMVIVLLGSLLQRLLVNYISEPFMAELTIPGLLIGVLFYTVFGFFCGALSAWVYNMIAKLVGGIKVNL